MWKSAVYSYCQMLIFVNNLLFCSTLLFADHTLHTALSLGKLHVEKKAYFTFHWICHLQIILLFIESVLVIQLWHTAIEVKQIKMSLGFISDYYNMFLGLLASLLGFRHAILRCYFQWHGGLGIYSNWCLALGMLLLCGLLAGKDQIRWRLTWIGWRK